MHIIVIQRGAVTKRWVVRVPPAWKEAVLTQIPTEGPSVLEPRRGCEVGLEPLCFLQAGQLIAMQAYVCIFSLPKHTNKGMPRAECKPKGVGVPFAVVLRKCS